MAKSRLYRILSRVAEIKPGEEVIAVFLFFYFFLITAPWGIIKPLRNANFLETLGPLRLPTAYLLTAILIGFVVAFHSKLQVKISRHLLIISCLIFFIFTCFLFWLLFRRGWSWLPLPFWIWANIFIFVLGTQFWITVNDVFDPREAKRLIGFFGSGGILGGIFGGLMAGFLAKSKLSEALLLIACGMLVACIFIVHYTFIWQRRRQPVDDTKTKEYKGGENEKLKVGFKDCYDTVKKHYYLKLLASVVAVTLVVSTLIDFQFNSVIDVKILGLENRISFFGFFNSGFLVLPFFIQLFMTSNLIRRYGIRFSLLLFPMVLLLLSFGIGVFPIILTGTLIYFGVFIKGSDKSLSFSLNQSVRELLYIPVSPEHKYKAKIFIDMFLNRFARGIGAIILFALTTFAAHAFGKDIKEHIVEYLSLISLASVVFILVWVFLNLKIGKEYTNTVREKIPEKWERADQLVAEKVDIDYTKLVFDILESKNRSSVLYAMHLFDLIKLDKLTPELKKLLSYKSDEMTISSLGALFGSDETTLIPKTDDIISEEFLAKEINEIMSLDVYQEVMESYVEKALREKGREAETTKMEVAKAIGLMDSHSPIAQKLEKLLQDESPEVRKYAIESASKLRQREYVPALVQKLSSPLAREDASAALEKYGSKVVGTLADYLGDTQEDIEMRKGVASVLARIGTQEAADFLSWELAEDKEDMDSELIDALDRIRSEKPGIQFQEDIVMRKTIKEVKKYYKSLFHFYDLKLKKEKAEVSRDLPESLNVFLMNIFKLLGLIYSQKDIVRAYQHIRAGTKDKVAYAIELLDGTLKKEIKDILFPLIEDISLEERVKRCRNLLKISPVL